LHVTEDERGTFVSGKAPGKADGQCLRIQQSARSQDLAGLHLSATPALSRPLVDKGQQLLFEMLVGGPENFVRYVAQSVPQFRVVVPLLPIIAQVFPEKILQGRRDPTGYVDSIGDSADGHLLDRTVRPGRSC
jgi:hypothetical protein